jgi:hypothetical protein
LNSAQEYRWSERPKQDGNGYEGRADALGNLISEDRARFAAEIGATNVVDHLTDHARGADMAPYLDGGTARGRVT